MNDNTSPASESSAVEPSLPTSASSPPSSSSSHPTSTTTDTSSTDAGQPAPHPNDTADDPDADRVVSMRASDFECPLCYSILYDPVTTVVCGHTLCRLCLSRSLSVKPFCPLCRSPCTMDALSHPPTSILSNLLSKYFRSEWKERENEDDAKAVAAARRRTNASPRYGLFLSHAPHMPNQTLNLHIFEPKYRIMIHRAVASGHRKFVVVCPNGQRTDDEHEHPNQHNDVNDEPMSHTGAAVNANTVPHAAAGGVAPNGFNPPAPAPAPAPSLPVHSGFIGCLVRITRIQGTVDGRSFIECVGESRVRLLNVLPGDGNIASPEAQLFQQEDASFGLLTAEVETIADVPFDEEVRELSRQVQMHEDARVEEMDESTNTDSSSSSSTGLRRRAVAAGSESNSSTAATAASDSSMCAASSVPMSSSSSAPAHPSPSIHPIDPLTSSLETLRSLVADYSSQSGMNLQRMAPTMPQPPPPPLPPQSASTTDHSLPTGDNSANGVAPVLTPYHHSLISHAQSYSWWLLHTLPSFDVHDIELKHHALSNRHLLQRLEVCTTLLRLNIERVGKQRRNQAKLACVICILALIMILMRQAPAA